MMPPERLPLIKRAFKLLTNELRPEDHVAIVAYAGNAGLVLPSTPGSDKKAILEALERLEAGGSTAGGAGIQLAYKVAQDNFLPKGNNRVILATDGDFNIGISSTGDLTRLIEEKRNTGIYLTTIGVGTDNYKDTRMEALADKGNGNYYYIDNLLEAQKVFVKQVGGTLNTIAKDVKIQIEFNPAKVKGYRLIGYENRLLAKEDFNNDKKDAGELGSGHTVTAMYEIIPAGVPEAHLDSVDTLKYQTTNLSLAAQSEEMMTVKFRYKPPTDTVSKFISQSVKESDITLAEASNNLRWATAVSEFGMLLTDSKFKGTASVGDALTHARSAKGRDEEGYRAEFIKLIEMYKLLDKASNTGEE
jgi:Ca-activated chloride channel family protein